MKVLLPNTWYNYRIPAVFLDRKVNEKYTRNGSVKDEQLVVGPLGGGIRALMGHMKV